jgi:hypothetical protein
MTHEELAAAEPISFLTAAGFSHQDVAALSHYVAHDVAIGDFRLCGNPCSSGLLFKGCVVAGVVELRKFGVTSREITEQYHCFTVQLPRQLARCRSHLAHREYSAAALNSTQANTTPLPATLEHVFGIDAMGAYQ